MFKNQAPLMANSNGLVSFDLDNSKTPKRLIFSRKYADKIDRSSFNLYVSSIFKDDVTDYLAAQDCYEPNFLNFPANEIDAKKYY